MEKLALDERLISEGRQRHWREDFGLDNRLRSSRGSNNTTEKKFALDDRLGGQPPRRERGLHTRHEV